MSKVYRFRMLSDENDRFVRDYELSADATLADFHRFLIEALEYEDCMASFFTADERWEKMQEFTLLDMGDEAGAAAVPMEQAPLDKVIRNRRDRLIWLFDLMGERAYYLEMTDCRDAEPGASYPREIYASADAPDQYDPAAGRDDDGSIFDDAMAEFGTYHADENFDDE